MRTCERISLLLLLVLPPPPPGGSCVEVLPLAGMEESNTMRQKRALHSTSTVQLAAGGSAAPCTVGSPAPCTAGSVEKSAKPPLA